MNRRAVVRVVAGYVVVGVLYIALSDSLVFSLFPADFATRVSTWKGFGFVGLTATALAWLLLSGESSWNARYQTLFEAHPSAMLLIDPVTRSVVDANPAAVRFYGWPLEKLRTMAVSDINTMSPERIAEQMALAARGGRTEYAFQHRVADGGLRHVTVRSNPIELAGRQLLCSIITDRTEQHEAESAVVRQQRLHALVASTNRLVAQSPDQTALFEGICRSAVNELGLLFAWVGRLEGDASAIPVALWGEDQGYVAGIHANALHRSERGRGPTGEAIRSGKHRVVNDFLADPDTAPWHEAARRAGIRSSAVFPLREEGRVVAALNVYGPHPGFFDAETVTVLDNVSKDISFGIDNFARATERTRILERLKIAENRWRFALEGAGHGVWEYNVVTDRPYYSPKLKELLGYPADEIAESLEDWRRRVHPDDLAGAERAMANYLAGEATSYRSEHRIQRKDGEYRWFLDQGKIMERDEAGLPVLVVGTYTDITEQRRAADQLRVNEERLRLALNSGQQGIFDLDVQTGETVVSPEYATMLGHDPATFHETNAAWLERLHPEDHERCAQVYSEYIAGRLPEYRVEFRQRASDGRWKWILSVARLVERDAHGQPKRMLGTHTDIDRLKELELGYERAEALGHFGSWTLSFESGAFTASAEAMRIYGGADDGAPLTYLDLADRIHPEDRELLGKALEACIESGAPGYRVEHRIRRPDLTERTVETRAEVQRDEHAVPVRLTGTVIDVTERRANEAKLALQARRAAVLLELPKAAERLDEHAFLQYGQEQAEALTGSRIAFIHFVNEDQRTLQLVAWSKQTLDPYRKLVSEPHDPFDEAGTWADAFRTRAPVIFNDSATAPGKRGLPEGHSQLERFISVPVIEDGQVRMLTGVGNKSSDYDETDVETVQLISEEMWRIVRRRRDEATLRASEVRYRALFASNPQPMWVYDVKSLRFLDVNDAAVSHYGYSEAEFLSMTIADIRSPDEAARLRAFLAEGKSKQLAGGPWEHVRKDGSVITVEVATHDIKIDGRTAVLVLSNDITDRVKAERERNAAEAKYRGLTEQSLTGIYMIEDGKLTYCNPRLAEIFGYTPDEMLKIEFASLYTERSKQELIARAAAHARGEKLPNQFEFTAYRKDGTEVTVGAASIVSNVDGKRVLHGVMQDITDKRKAEEQVLEYVKKVERAMTTTIGAVSTMMDLRDPYTAGHERRVGLLASAIAAEMGLDLNIQRGLELAGLVHDVGKITVPAETLSKPSKLTAMEYELIKEHAEQGYRVLKDVELPWPIAEVARQHHERMDGTGYPRGLKGTEILLEARITAVADVMESMASHRPYRPSRGIPVALEEIEKNAGRLYDPDAAAACLRLFREKAYVLPP